MQSSESRARLVQCIFVIIGGVVFLLVGLMIPSAYGSRLKCTERVTATVVRNLEHLRTSSGTVRNPGKIRYAPIFEYEYNGRKYSVISSVASDPPEFSEGEVVTIRVNPNDPDEIYYTPRGGSLAMSIIFTIAGGALAIGGIIILIVMNTKSKPPKQTLN